VKNPFRKDIVLFLFTFSIWTVVNVYFGTITLIVSWIFQPYTGGNSILPLSILWSLITFAYAFRQIRTGIVSRLLVSATVPFAFLSTFEILYQHLFLFVRTDLFRTNLQGEIVLGTWFLLGLTSVNHWQVGRKSLAVFFLLIAGFTLWSLVGYPQIYDTGGTQGTALLFNAATKSLAAILFMVLLSDKSGRSA
jgi:hypothetical protein